MFDYLIVGTGLFGSVFAHEAKKAGKKCLMVEKRDHIGGNIYTKEVEGIQVHQYGAHIFHTSNKRVWNTCRISRSLTGTPTVRSPIIRDRSTICRSI